MKRLLLMFFTVCLALALLLPGCTEAPSEPMPAPEPAPVQPEPTPPATTNEDTTSAPTSEPTETATQRPASAPSVPIKVNLSISEPLEFNKPTQLTCTLSSLVDAPNTEARVKLPDGATLISGTLTWQGGLKANEPFSFSAQIVFDKEGKWAIEGIVSDWSNGWGDLDRLYLTIGAERSELGWPPTGPVKVRQVEKGDVEPVPSSTAEPAIEDLPEPPAISP